MIGIGIDPHMKTHTAVALDTATGARVGERSVTCDGEGHDELLFWARGLGDGHALEGVRRCRDLTADIRSLEREIREYMRELAADRMAIPGCSAILAAHLVGQVDGFLRFRDEAPFAMHVGTAPLPVSSGKSERYRLNRTGNRTPTPVIHVIAVTRARMHPLAIAFIERKRAEGMSDREALRCMKRHIRRVLYTTMVRAEKARAASVVRIDFPPCPVAVAM